MAYELVISWGCEIDSEEYCVTSRGFKFGDNVENLITFERYSCNDTMIYAINGTDYKLCVYKTCEYRYISILELRNTIIDLTGDDVGFITHPSPEDIDTFLEFASSFNTLKEFKQHYIITSRIEKYDGISD